MSDDGDGLTTPVYNEGRSQAALRGAQRLVKVDTDPRK
jgi:hypothetical protein